MTRDIFTTTTAALFFTAASLLADLARADTVPIRTRDAVEGKCSSDGDVFFPPSAAGVYACLKKDGSGVVCGGTTDDFKKTCDTWPADSKPSPRAPDKLHEAAKKKAADKAAKKK
jgi:hypothetical protein